MYTRSAIFLLLLMFSFSCRKPIETAFTPVVATDPVTEITSNGAVAGGNIISNAGHNIVLRGVCYSTHRLPDAGDSIVMTGSGDGKYKSPLVNLKPETLYYVRAFALNIKGFGYGEEVYFSTPK